MPSRFRIQRICTDVGHSRRRLLYRGTRMQVHSEMAAAKASLVVGRRPEVGSASIPVHEIRNVALGY